MDDAQKWQDASEHVVKAVVTILFYRPRPFDTEEACCSEATGFVVDAKRGIICTNRVELLQNDNFGVSTRLTEGLACCRAGTISRSMSIP